MNKIKKLRKIFINKNLDGYIIPKNDEFFGEYVPELNDNLKFISNFTGSFGFALILKNENYLFVDGRYTLQAKIQCGKIFKIITVPKKNPSDILKNKKFSIGFDPKLHTEPMFKHFFKNSKCKLIPLKENLINQIWLRKNKKKSNKFYKISNKNAGENSKSKIRKLSSILKKNKVNVHFVSASENVAWLLNLRGSDSKFAPIPHSYAIINDQNKVYLFCDLKKISKKLKNNL